MLNPLSVLVELASVLERHQIKYAVVGSLATSAYGMYRSTADIDILADLKQQHLIPLLNSLQNTFYVDEVAAGRAIEGSGSFKAIHLEFVFKVDFFVRKDEPFDKKQLERRELRPLAPNSAQSVYVASAEDTILAKLRWYRAGNEVSNTQWSDVVGIVGVSAENLDQSYLNQWSQTLRVSDLLHRAFEEAGIRGNESK